VLPANRLAGLCPACTWSDLFEGEPDLEGKKLPSESSPLTQTAANRSTLRLPIPGYEVLDVIDRGGMGIVYRARQLHPNRLVALKMLLPHQVTSPDAVERFRQEVRALTELDHPNILPVYQVGDYEGMPFFTMKLATAGSLSAKRSALDGRWTEIAELMATLAEAVHFAHERGILHRDLKPANVLFDDAGRPYISDFGIAKVASADASLTRSVEFLGSPHYAAPEVLARGAREATIASDIYGLGAILYELLAGRPPFQAETVPDLLRKIAETQPARLATRSSSVLPGQTNGHPRPDYRPVKVPRDLEVICFKCLAKKPAARYATAHDLALDLRRWMEGKTILARPATGLERAIAWSRRNPGLAAALALLTLALPAAAILQWVANQHLEQALTDSLLAQARLQRSSGRAGQRFQSLALLREAAKHRHSGLLRSGRSDRSNATAGLRTEAAGAIALPDVQELTRWPIQISHLENECDFTSNLQEYLAPSKDGGFALFSTTNSTPLWTAAPNHGTPAIELRITGDGRYIAARFQNGQTELWDRTQPKPVRTWNGRSGTSPPLAFDPAGTRFAIANSNSDGKEQLEVIELPATRTLARIPIRGQSSALVFDPSAQQIALATDSLAVWSLKTSNTDDPVWRVPLSHQVSVMAWSPNGRTLAAALDQRTAFGREQLSSDTIYLFDAADGSGKRLFAEAGARVERMAFHPDGQSMAAATWNGELIWAAVQPGGFRLSIPGMQRAVAFNSAGTLLGYAPSRDELGVLQLSSPLALHTWPQPPHVSRESFALAVSSDGRLLAVGNETQIVLWDTVQRRELDTLTLPSTHWWLTLLFGPEDRFLYFSAVSFGVRRVELVSSPKSSGASPVRFGPQRVIGPEKGVTATGYSADQHSLIIGENKRRDANQLIPPTMWVWQDADPTRARKLVENFPLVGLRVVPGGKWAVTTELVLPDLWIWNYATGERIRNLGIPLQVSSELPPNGRWIVTRSRQELATWEVGSWRKLASHAIQDEGEPMVASPDSRLLVTRLPSGNLVLRQLPDGTELLKLPGSPHLRNYIFSPDGQRLFVVLNTGQLLDWNLRELREQLRSLELDWKDTPVELASKNR